MFGHTTLKHTALMTACFFVFGSNIISGNALAKRKNPCKGMACSGHGSCVVVEGQPRCACESGFVPDRYGINCLPETPTNRPVTDKAVAKPKLGLSKQDIISLHRSAMPEEEIIQMIRRERLSFKVSIQDVLEMKEAGVPDGVVKVALASSQASETVPVSDNPLNTSSSRSGNWESCTRTADCRADLVCVRGTCVAPEQKSSFVEKKFAGDPKALADEGLRLEQAGQALTVIGILLTATMIIAIPVTYKKSKDTDDVPHPVLWTQNFLNAPIYAAS